MKIKTAASGREHLAKQGRFLMLTHGEAGSSYSMDNGAAVPKNVAQQLQSDLFVKPSGDGLFPGFTQTWKVEG